MTTLASSCSCAGTRVAARGPRGAGPALTWLATRPGHSPHRVLRPSRWSPLATLPSTPVTRCDAARHEAWRSAAKPQSGAPWARLPVALLAGVVGLAALFGAPNAALAARSGGRVGGSSFSSRGSSSPSYSYSGGKHSAGMGAGWGSSRMAPSTTVIRTGTSVGFFPIAPTYGFYGGGFSFMSTATTLIIVAALVFVAAQAFNSGGMGMADDEGYFGSERVTVAKVQLGLIAEGRRMQRDLERIAGRADTSDSDGLQFVLQETVLNLLRRPEVWVYGYSEGKSVTGAERGEEEYNRLSMSERGKFEKETFVNYGGRTRKAEMDGNSEAVDELIVITILVAYEGGVKLNKCRDREEVRATLETLGGLRADQILAVEVLWTPSDDKDAFTRNDIIQDYPQLNTL